VLASLFARGTVSRERSYAIGKGWLLLLLQHSNPAAFHKLRTSFAAQPMLVTMPCITCCPHCATKMAPLPSARRQPAPDCHDLGLNGHCPECHPLSAVTKCRKRGPHFWTSGHKETTVLMAGVASTRTWHRCWLPGQLVECWCGRAEANAGVNGVGAAGW
jgi:hypothetical protein